MATSSTDTLSLAADPEATSEVQAAPRGRYLLLLSLSALGVVYGDIGTSPLYALRECFFGEHAIAPTPANVLGVLSLIVWSLVLVISLKYLLFVMRADNEGEGGILALMALSVTKRGGRGRWLILGIGLFGAALLYGDGMITPAISVLSAVEGLEIATPFFQPYVIPITILILVALFMVQKHGTAGIGKIFGPVTLVWFVILAVLGVAGILRHPDVLGALSPHHAVSFFVHNGGRGLVVLGAVFLVVTGGEALYADMGHFGARPIRLAWFVLVLPALVLNYFGQGAIILARPDAAENPFYRLMPSWALYPMVVMATAATVIASQAVISGAFSLTMQAIRLGFFPRVLVNHTSERERGQIYIPFINVALMIATILLVLAFRRSTNLAAAYGIAVTTTMVITTLLLYVVARERWGWRRIAAVPLALFMLSFDLAFFGANIFKIPAGGWFPLTVAAAMFVVMTTWKRGREILAQRLRLAVLSQERFLDDLLKRPVHEVPGTAVFMTGDSSSIPVALVQNVKHNKILHEQVVLLTIHTADTAHVRRRPHVELSNVRPGIDRVVAEYGFMDEPSVPEVLRAAGKLGLKTDKSDTTFFLSRETIFATPRPGMAIWREKLFAFLSRNALSATAYFKLPMGRVVEVGTQVDL